MRIFFICLLAALSFAYVSQTHAFDVQINHVPGKTIFFQEFDHLSLDIVVPFTQEGDAVNAITVINPASIFNGRYVNLIRLYVDEGPVGFQGLGVDKDLGVAKYLSAPRHYVFENLDIPIPEEGIRLFFTVESSNSFTGEGFVQLAIPGVVDMQTTGQYDQGDAGIFTAKGEVGPIMGVRNTSRTALKTATQDRVKPKSNLTSVFDGDMIFADTLRLTGVARDGGGSSVKKVDIGISQDDMNYAWFSANSDMTGFKEFSYVWEDIAAGEYYLRTMSEDLLGNRFTSEAIKIKITDTPIEEEREEDMDLEIPSIEIIMRRKFAHNVFSGDVIALSQDSTLYYVNEGGHRMVFPSRSVFRSWYNNFQGVKILSADQLKDFPVGGLVSYRPGARLLKIASDPKVYAVDRGGVLRWILNEQVAFDLYGSTWNEDIDALDVTQFSGYRIGEPITKASEFDLSHLLENITTIAGS